MKKLGIGYSFDCNGKLILTDLVENTYFIDTAIDYYSTKSLCFDFIIELVPGRVFSCEISHKASCLKGDELWEFNKEMRSILEERAKLTFNF